jgi:hypothetical protein
MDIFKESLIKMSSLGTDAIARNFKSKIYVYKMHKLCGFIDKFLAKFFSLSSRIGF